MTQGIILKRIQALSQQHESVLSRVVMYSRGKFDNIFALYLS